MAQMKSRISAREYLLGLYALKPRGWRLGFLKSFAQVHGRTGIWLTASLSFHLRFHRCIWVFQCQHIFIPSLSGTHHLPIQIFSSSCKLAFWDSNFTQPGFVCEWKAFEKFFLCRCKERHVRLALWSRCVMSLILIWPTEVFRDVLLILLHRNTRDV